MASSHYFHFYKSKENTVILCYTDRKYRLILWEQNGIEDDVFTKGQWLTKGEIESKKSFVSQCGTYFKYKYKVKPKFDHDPDVDKEQSWPSIYTVISRAPYFTALYKESESYWTEHKKKGTSPVNIKWCSESDIPKDYKIDNGKILKNRTVVLDISNDTFEFCRAPYKSADTPNIGSPKRLRD